MEPMESPNFLEHAELLDENTPHYLNAFHKYLIQHNMSPNTITAYIYSVRHFFTYFGQLNSNNVSLYKVYLLDHYQPQTVNMRIRALNCFLKFQGISDYRIRALRLQQKKYTDYIISQADYEYLKRRLREDEQYTFYFIIRFITATGVRVSELISFQIQDVINGYKDIYSKGNKMRRVYIPTTLQEDTLRWLESESRKNGPLFLSHLKRGISVSGIHSQLKTFAYRYHLDPKVVYPHSFRHRFAKNFIENGGDIAFLSNLLGHTSIETTRIYLRRSSTEQSLIVNQIVDW